jgi:hypothetical protein
MAAHGRRHPRYADEVAFADLCAAILGDTKAQREILEKFRSRETAEEMEQRVSQTNSVTRAVLSPAMSYLNAPMKADGLRMDVEGDEQIKARLMGFYDRFYKGEGLLEYLHSMAKYAVKLDPNAWTVFQYKTTTNPGNGAMFITDIYPIEVPCRDVVSYQSDETGEWLYMAFERGRTLYNERGIEKNGKEFWLYGRGYSIHLVEDEPGYTDGVDYAELGYERTQANRKGFFIRVFPNTTIEVPAHRWDAYPSDVHDNDVGAPFYNDAVGLLLDIIKDKSVFDMTKLLHAFVKETQYVKRCDDVDEESGAQCEGGWYNGIRDAAHRCKACNGFGAILPSTEQRTTTLAWPERAEEIFELSKLQHYHDRPIQILEFFRRELDIIAASCHLAIFGQQGVKADAIASIKTATQSVIEADKVNDKLRPFTDCISKAWELAWRVGFQFFDREPDVVILRFPSDFKVEPLDDLLARYKQTDGMPYSVRQGVMQDILAKLYRNNPDIVQFEQAVENWRPFKTKSLAEMGLIIQMRDVADPDRQLWEQWDKVITELRRGVPRSVAGGTVNLPFFVLPYEEQRAIIYGLAAAFAEQVRYVQMGGDNTGLEQLFEQLALGQEGQIEPIDEPAEGAEGEESQTENTDV